MIKLARESRLLEGSRKVYDGDIPTCDIGRYSQVRNKRSPGKQIFSFENAHRDIIIGTHSYVNIA